MTVSAPVILVIEDEAPIRRFVRISLESDGYHPIEATTGQQGLREAESLQIGRAHV